MGNTVISKAQLKFASEDQKRRAKACHSFERGQQVYVIPSEPAKEARIVIFLNEGILCIEPDGTACPANDHKKLCYHALSAARRKVINSKRRQTIATKREQKAA